MLPLLSRTGSPAARRTWFLLGVAGLLAVALPTAHTVARPRIANTAAVFAAAADSSAKVSADSIAHHGKRPADPFATGEDGGFVEFLPRPTREEMALEQPLDFEVVELPFEDCIKLFAQKAKINVMLDIQRLVGDGISLDQPISLNLKGGRAGSVLNRLLEPLELAALFEEDILRVTTAAFAGDRLILRWYPVWDLYPGPAVPQPNAPSARQHQPGFGGLVGPRGEFDLITAITTTIEPDS